MAAVTLDGACVGYLPSRTAMWLAPLLDGGMIELDAYVSTRWEPEPDSEGQPIPLALRVWLLPEGYGLLQPKPDRHDEAQVLHNVVLKTYLDSQRLMSRTGIEETRRHFEELLHGVALPETHLLVALYPGHAMRSRRRLIHAALRDSRAELAGLQVAEPVRAERLTIVPLCDPAEEPRCTLLADALEIGDAEVRETGREGEVPRVLLENRGAAPVLAVEGDVLAGGKQNRLVIGSTVVAPGASSRVPVTCVERGRWRDSGEPFGVVYAAPPTLRARASGSALRRQETGPALLSDQDEVWRAIAACAEPLGAACEHESITDVFVAADERLAEREDGLPVPEGARGVAVLLDGRLIAIDIFDSARGLRRAWPRLCEAWFLEELARPEVEGRKLGLAPEAVPDVVERVAEKLRPGPERTGTGVPVEVRQEGLLGSGIWFGGGLCHLSVFPAPPASN
jgi:hypothetical protein